MLSKLGFHGGLFFREENSLGGHLTVLTQRKSPQYTAVDVNRLMAAEGMIKNKAKIAAAITNAQEFIKIQREFGSFDAFIWQFVGGKTKHNAFK